MSNHEEPEKAPYEIGYGKPPKSRQFKKGKSGNSKGRPKGAKNFKTLFMEEMAETIWVPVNGKQVKMTKGKASVRQLWVDTMKSKPSAVNKFYDLAMKFEGTESEIEVTEMLGEDDQAIVDDFLNRNKSKDGRR